MKILYLNTSGEIGGTQKCVINLSREFSERGSSVGTVFEGSGSSSEKLLSWCRKQGVDGETDPAVPGSLAHRGVRQMIALQRLVRLRAPDVVHLHFGGSHLSLKDAISVRLSGTKACVVSIHAATPEGAENERQRRLTRLAASVSHAVIVYSQAVQKELLELGVPEHRIHLVRLGVYPPTEVLDRAEARRRLQIPDSAFVVATCARLVQHKGIGDLIDAVARLVGAPEQVVLLIAGEGPDREAFEAQARAHGNGRVRFLGHRDDVSTVYSAADVFSLPSHDARESFGLVFIEAALQGRPSVGTHVGGIPEAVVDGVTGILVPPKNVEALGAALQRLRDEQALSQQLGEAGRLRASEQFTVRAMVDAHQHIYNSLLGAGGSR